MGILNQARASVIWRGYEYYKDKKVINFRKESDSVFYGSVKGTTTYDVKIDINHTVKNTYCNCPFAKDNRKICKHMVALYFTAFLLMKFLYIIYLLIHLLLLLVH